MSGAPPPDLVGQLIAGRYQVESVIGSGGQGVVYRARDNETKSGVALKVLSDASARDPQRAARFLREQASLQALSGTSAVKVFDAGQTADGCLYLVLELLDGRDLQEELEDLEARSERMTLERVAEIMAPVASTLDAAHTRGIFHRDLKPANIFLLKPAGVRLLDFGFARMRSGRHVTVVGTIMGSPSYIAPEAWQGRRELADHRVDVYSLAVILFRLLSGQLPLHADSRVEMFKLATRAPRPSLHALRPDLPESIDAWVKQALAIDRNERFRSAGTCLKELFACLGAEALLPATLGQAPVEDEASESAAEKIASVLQIAAATLMRWTTRND